MDLMSVVLERGNMMRAYERVLRNKGAAGVDGMTVGDLKAHLKANWPGIRDQGAVAGRPIHAFGGAQGRDTQARWRTAHAGDTHGAGSTHPASPASGSESCV